jgi:hypothetical protein
MWVCYPKDEITAEAIGLGVIEYRLRSAVGEVCSYGGRVVLLDRAFGRQCFLKIWLLECIIGARRLIERVIWSTCGRE